MAKIVRCFPKKMYSPVLAFFAGFSTGILGGASTGIPYHKSIRPSLNTAFNTLELSKTILPDCSQTIPESGFMALFLQDPVVGTIVPNSPLAGRLKNISSKDVVVGKVVVVDAAAEGVAGIVLAVRPMPLSGSQPYPVTP